MKRLLLFVLVIGLAGCKKEKPVDPQTAIVGKWLAASADYIYYKDGKEVFRETLTGVQEGTPTNTTFISYYYQFNANGMVDVYDYSERKNAFAEYAVSYGYNLSNANATLNLTSTIITYSTVASYDLAFSNNDALTLTDSRLGMVSYRVTETSPYLFAESLTLIRHFKRF